MESRFPRHILIALVGVVALLIFATGVNIASHQAPPAPPKPHIPSTVDVNGVMWRVVVVNKPADTDVFLGYTSCLERRIEIAAREEDKQDGLIHELSHALVCVGDDSVNGYYSQTNDEKHEAIYHFAQLWSELLRRNPAVADYLGHGDPRG